uniref:PepT protein n=1 Tax=Fopius arisanus TaxID=64838 RepID=A0A0C9QGU1_9HYME
MLRKSLVTLLLLLLIMNIDGANTKEKKRESLFSKLKWILRAAVEMYRILKKIITHPDNVNLMLDEFMDWIADEDTDDHEIIQAKLTGISSQLNWIMTRMEAKFSAIEQMIIHLPLTIEIDSIKRDLALTIRKIKNLYDAAFITSSNINEHNKVELQNLANTLTGRQSGDLRDSLYKLYDYIVPTTAHNLKQSFLDLLNHHVQTKGKSLCGDVQTPNQYLYQLHKVVVTTELMGQVALTFGYYLQNQLNNVSIDFELKRAQVERRERLQNYFNKFKSSMNNSSLSLRPCDPTDFIRDETYIEMEHLYQAVLVEDYNLNYKDSCRGTCETIDVSPHRNDNDGVLCARLHNCWKLKTSRYCIRPSELRRYEWIEDRHGTIYGNKNGCQGQELATPGWRKRLFPCENCICTCQGGHKWRMPVEVQAFSLRASRSNTTNNMVITGVKFSRHESIICIQIKEGKLLPEGEIEEGSEKWRDCDLSYASYRAARFSSSDYKHGKDFVVLSSDYNYIDLDDIFENRPETEIITGIKFSLSDYCAEGRHVKLQLEYAKFNFTSGELTTTEGFQSPSTCHSRRVNMVNLDSPLNQRKPRDQNTPDFKLNSYVRFGWTNFKKDVGQTTIPLLDAQPVETKPSAPLTGIELFYKSSPGYGGFLAFKIRTLNYAKYMEEEMTEEFSDEDPRDLETETTEEYFSKSGIVITNEATQEEDDGPNKEAIHWSDRQSTGVDQDYPSYSPYFMFIAVPLFIAASVYVLITLKKCKEHPRPIIIFSSLSSDEKEIK